MSKITGSTRPIDIENLEPYAGYLMYRVVPADKPAAEMTFEELKADQPTWDIDSMIRGMEHLSELAGKQKIMYDVYPPEECVDDPEKKEVKLFYLPAGQQSSDKPFIICVSGGAYTCVCSMVESLPTAVRFNQLGYNVFVFNYRVQHGEDSLFPKPADDLAAAVKFILGHKETFGLNNTEYVVNGYSAGGSLTSIFGTERNGYAKYGLPKPKALFPIYPAISTSEEFMQGEPRAWFMSIMFGKDFDESYAETFQVPEHMTAGYPPCYIVHAKDDPVVDCKNSKELYRLLKERNIPAELELAEFGGHGWGDGSGSGAAGWPDRAIHFLENL